MPVCTVLSCSRECPFSLAHSFRTFCFLLSGFFCVVLLSLLLTLPMLLLLPFGSQHHFTWSRLLSCAQYSLTHVIALCSLARCFALSVLFSRYCLFSSTTCFSLFSCSVALSFSLSSSKLSVYSRSSSCVPSSLAHKIALSS